MDFSLQAKLWCLSLYLILVTCAVSQCHAQDQIIEPQYIGQYAFLGPTGQLVPLESAQGKSETRSKSIIISNKVTSSYVIQGAASSLRVGPLAHFVVRVGPIVDSTDPASLVTMRSFTLDGAKRTIPTASASAGIFQPLKSGTASVISIPLSFKKYGQSSLEIIPQQPLPPGEYMFGTPHSGQPTLCFGVDASGPASAAVTAAPVAAPTATPARPAMPALAKWSEPMQDPITSDVKAACESTDPGRQAYCFGIFSAYFEDYKVEQDGENAHPFCFPKDVTAGNLRDAFLEETKAQPDQLLGPLGIFWGVTEDHHFRCPAVVRPRRATPSKKRN